MLKFKPEKIIFLIIVLISFFKLTLINKGFKAFPDEERYNQSGQILKNIVQKEPVLAIESLFNTQGRPGEALIKTIPVFFQIVTAKILGLEIYEPDNSFPLFIFNFIICGLMMLVHFKFSELFLKNKFLSIISVLIFSCLIASYISLRHADPYDVSFLILYFVLFKLLKGFANNSLDNLKLFKLGFIAFFGYLNYPGYILLYFVIVIVLFFNLLTKNNFIEKTKQSLFFALGSFICLTIFETLSWTINKSFITDSIVLSKTILQGSFEECYSFIFKYLIEVEGISGILLIFGLILSLFCLFKKKVDKTFKVLFLTLIFIFLAYSTLGFYFHKVVWYARLLRQFIPFLVLFLVASINELIKLENHKKIVFSIFGMVFLINFTIKIIEYKSYYYPKDVVWQIYKKYKTRNFQEIYEYDKVYSDLTYFNKINKNKSIIEKQKIILVNFGLYYPFNDLKKYKVYKNTKNQKLILSLKNAVQYKAYLFEGYNVIERQNINETNLDLKVYKEN